MVKPATKWRKGTTALSSKKSSQNPVDALTGKTNPRTQGPLAKNLQLHVLCLLAHITVCQNQ